jgi:hypothetical protein
MLGKWMEALFAPKYPRHYTGRHRAPRFARPTEVAYAADQDFG